ncbi:MAG: hypothetical protein D8B54_01705 [Catonella sp.]|nr:MAG: hypothetical protein D8B54_01705 [Catonella sp.]
MYTLTSVYQWEILSFACLPEQAILERLIELLRRCEDQYQNDSNEREFLADLWVWAHDLSSILLKAQTSPEPLGLSSYDGCVWIKLTVDNLGHYEFEMLDDLYADRYVAKMAWINPIL